MAAALAVVAQGDTPLLLEAEAFRQQRFDNDRPARDSGFSRGRIPRRRSASRLLGSLRDVPHRGGSSSARRAPSDRRRPRERGWSAPQRLRCDPDPSGLLARRAARRPVERHDRPPRRHPHLGPADRPAPTRAAVRPSAATGRSAAIAIATESTASVRRPSTPVRVRGAVCASWERNRAHHVPTFWLPGLGCVQAALLGHGLRRWGHGEGCRDTALRRRARAARGWAHGRDRVRWHPEVEPIHIKSP